MSSKTKTTATKEEAQPALVPKLRFREFRDADGWKERQLGEFLSESRLPGSKGNVAKKITVKLWGNGVFEKNDAIQGSINTQYFRRKAGQFIYSKLDFLNQAFGIIPPSLDNFESTVDLPCFDITGELNPVFLLEYVKRKDFYERLGETADGSRKARRIHAETFLSFSAALPTLAEQQKIAECLSSVDELMAAQARKVDALKTHKKGLMQQLFPREGETQPRLRFPEFQNAGEWDSQPFHVLYEFKPTNTYSRDQLNYESGSAKNIHYGDIHTKFSTSFRMEAEMVPFVNPSESLSKLKSDAYCQEGDMVFADASEDLTDVGKSIELVDLNGERVLSGSHTILARQKRKVFIVGFAGHLFKGRGVRAQIEREAQGTKVLQISPGRLAGIKVVFPQNKEEQQRIASCLSSLDALITAEAQKLEALKTHKKGLMQQLFPSPEEVEA